MYLRVVFKSISFKSNDYNILYSFKILTIIIYFYFAYMTLIIFTYHCDNLSINICIYILTNYLLAKWHA